MLNIDGLPAYLMSVPEEMMLGYSADGFEQQMQDDITAESFNFIVNCKYIRAIHSGHLHKDFEGEISNGKYQYTTGCSTVREIILINS